MPQYWEITTNSSFDHGSDIVGKPARVTFIINPATGERIDAQPPGTLFAWRAANQVSFQTAYMLSPFKVTPINWVYGQLDIYVSATQTITKYFAPANVVDNS